MKAILVLFLTFFSIAANAIPEGKIDSLALQLINKYDAYIIQENLDVPTTHFLLRIDRSEEIAYITGITAISTFVNNLPEFYVKIGTRIIFVYEQNNQTDSFTNFFNQFESTLENDVTEDGRPNRSFRPTFVIHADVWRADLSSRRLGKIKVVPMFPLPTFFDDFRYDQQGFLVYKDGIYHESSIDPHQWEPDDDFDLRTYILENTSVPPFILEEGEVDALLVFDAKGKVIAAEIEGLDNQEYIEQIKRALAEMPKWNPGRIGGKAVKVRILHRL